VPIHKQKSLPDGKNNFIPLDQSSKKPDPWVDPAAEAFMVNTQKIFLVIVVHLIQDRKYRGEGYATFADGHTLNFSIDADEFAKVRDKCLMVAQRIARAYGGTLQRGKMDGGKEPVGKP
jgi:hypothetical protein